ncbi:apolipoprotein N-acyltransferase [Vacuolonema iberomarrocanum]|uniref:apolipoprotein N-acyltransferase n=1 Tax=Vacuolonema iberomarrocanum TaxID=3454632 RepID=UPI003F6E0C83
MSRPWQPLTIAFLSGVAMAGAIAPLNLWILGWLALAPLWLILRQPHRQVSRRSKILAGTAWAVGYNGVTIAWILDLHPLTWLGIPWLGSVAITLFGWGFIVFWSILRLLTWACLTGWLFGWSGMPKETPGAILRRVLGAIALWCAVEVAWSYTPLDWTPLAFTQSPGNLWVLHLGQLSGPQTISAVLVAVNLLLAEGWRQRSQLRRRFWASAVAIAAIAHLLGLWLYLQPVTSAPDSELRIGIIQGNIPTRIKLFDEGVRRSLEAYTQGYLTLADQGADAILTPEGSFPWFWVNTSRMDDHPFYQALLERNVPAWVGTLGRAEKGGVAQSLFSFGRSGEIVGRYDKAKLVPLGEYLPLESLISRVLPRLSTSAGSLQPGASNQVVETPFGRAIAAICYDSAFPYIFRNQAATGGEFIITASNNDPFNAAMMQQHHAHDVMRAIETQRFAVRATNTGFSGVVDPHGHTLWKSGFRTYETHLATINRLQSQTPYVRWGNLLTPILVAIALLWKLRAKLTADNG